MNTTRSTNVEVAIRARPMRPDEGGMGWDIEDNTLTEAQNPDTSFSFDRVYGPGSNTKEIYEKSVKHNIVVHVSNGYSGTVFAYGQTSSGKTFTMLGNEKNPGVTDMALNDLFDLLDRNERPKGYKIRVFLEMIEIYNENLRDLLQRDDSQAHQLRIAEDEFGVYVRHAVRREVTTAKECLDVMAHESQARVVAHTNMNHESSRSHCLIRVTVEKTMVLTEDDKDKDEEDSSTAGSPTDPAPTSRRVMERKVISSLNLVDLAGSERVSKTGADGLRLKEGGLINKSLSTLTNVIMKMSEPRKPGHAWHIPFRDSKLTHLLKTAIGGNSFTTVFCCMTPSEYQVDESRSTLQFAQRAKKIRNEVQMNEVADPRTKVRTLEMEIKRLRRIMVATDLYLWSKQLRIRHLQERLGGGGAGGASGGGCGGAGAMGSELLTQNLIEENERLRNDLQNALNAVTAMGGTVTQSADGNGEIHVDPNLGTTSGGGGGGSEEVKQRLFAAEQEAREAKGVRDNLQQQVAEMEDMLDEMQAESETRERAKDEQLGQLREQVRAYEDDKQQRAIEITSLQAAVKNLQAQLNEACDQLASEAKGDEVLEKFNELQTKYNALTFEHNTLFEMYEKTEVDKAAKEASMAELLQDAETRCIAVKGEMSTLQGHAWRFIQLAHVVVGGGTSSSGGDAPQQQQQHGGPGHQVRQQQVDHAFRVLNDLVNRRGGSGAMGPFGGDADDGGAAFKRSATTTSGHVLAGSFGGVDAETNPDVLHRKIKELENIIVQKDNHRDVIIDTKLKRMQELVMRLHTANTTMQLEVERVVAENKRLHELVARDGKLSAIVRADALEPASADLIKSQATFAPTPSHPYNHN